MLMLDRFDGLLINENISSEDKERYLDNYKDLDTYYLNIKTRSKEFLEFLNAR